MDLWDLGDLWELYVLVCVELCVNSWITLLGRDKKIWGQAPMCKKGEEDGILVSVMTLMILVTRYQYEWNGLAFPIYY